MWEFLAWLIGDLALSSLPAKAQWGCIAVIAVAGVALFLAIWLM